MGPSPHHHAAGGMETIIRRLSAVTAYKTLDALSVAPFGLIGQRTNRSLPCSETGCFFANSLSILDQVVWLRQPIISLRIPGAASISRRVGRPRFKRELGIPSGERRR